MGGGDILSPPPIFRTIPADGMNGIKFLFLISISPKLKINEENRCRNNLIQELRKQNFLFQTSTKFVCVGPYSNDRQNLIIGQMKKLRKQKKIQTFVSGSFSTLQIVEIKGVNLLKITTT